MEARRREAGRRKRLRPGAENLLKQVGVKFAETGEEIHKSLGKIRKDFGKVQEWSADMTRDSQHDTGLAHFGDDY